MGHWDASRHPSDSSYLLKHKIWSICGSVSTGYPQQMSRSRVSAGNMGHWGASRHSSDPWMPPGIPVTHGCLRASQ